MKNRNRPAMPTKIDVDRNTCKFIPHQFDNDSFVAPGLTKLEHVAAMAMQGLIAARYGDMESDYIAQEAVEMACALFDKLEKGNEK